MWAPPLGFENTFALVMRADQARAARRSRRSRTSRATRSCAPGFGYEFVERADGFPGLAAAYGLAFAARPAEMDLGLLYPALAQGKVDVVAGNSTDGLIAAMRLAVLEDDRRYFPPYEAAFVVRGTRSGRTRACAARSSRWRERSPPTRCARMNAAVDRDERRPADVAREFLSRGWAVGSLTESAPIFCYPDRNRTGAQCPALSSF